LLSPDREVVVDVGRASALKPVAGGRLEPEDFADVTVE
jgi:hypothetical protein